MRQELSPPRRWLRSLAPVVWLWGWLYDKGWPSYDCADCIGMGNHGCYCSYYDAVGPCEEPSEVHLLARWWHGFIFTTSSPFWRTERA